MLTLTGKKREMMRYHHSSAGKVEGLKRATGSTAGSPFFIFYERL
jgi:hypothetical protein